MVQHRTADSEPRRRGRRARVARALTWLAAVWVLGVYAAEAWAARLWRLPEALSYAPQHLYGVLPLLAVLSALVARQRRLLLVP